MKYSFCKQWARKGFTLAELMAVVVIVAIIAGIGFGMYRKSVERAIFNDGLTGAHTLAAAYDSYFYENGSYPTSAAALDVSLTKSVVSGLTVNTEHFKYVLDSGVLSAVRNGGNYTLMVVLDSTGSAVFDRCVGTNTAGVEFCQSMGYACSSSGTGNGSYKCS